MRSKPPSQSKPAVPSIPPQGTNDGESDSAQTEVSAIWPVGEVMGYCCFVVVAEELHFTRSSHRLRMDQSVVSRNIQKLESTLGLKLFVRGDRRVELTDAGWAFLPYARKALIAAKAGVRIAQAVGRGEPQELEVAYSTLVDPHLLAQIKVLADSARPSIPVRFRSTPPDKLVERLFEGKSHMAITLLPVERDIASTCLMREELFAVVPVEHRLAQRPNLTIGEIGNDPVIWACGASAPAFTNDLFKRFRNSGYIPNVTHEAQTIAEALGLAREGLGITFVKTSDRHLIGGGLTILPLTTPFPVETGVLYVRECQWELLKAFISLVTNHCHSQPRASTAVIGAPSSGA